MAKKCPECGLINWEHDELCKRCNTLLNRPTPPVYRWFVAYCVGMALLALGTAAMGIVFMFSEPDPEMSAEEAKVMGLVCLVLGLVFFVPYAFAPFLPRQSWAWVFGLVLICIGLTSTCCLPAAIPLLIFWLKPEMKAFYGRLPDALPPPPPQWS